jgi:hypothetical protein
MTRRSDGRGIAFDGDRRADRKRNRWTEQAMITGVHAGNLGLYQPKHPMAMKAR